MEVLKLDQEDTRAGWETNLTKCPATKTSAHTGLVGPHGALAAQLVCPDPEPDPANAKAVWPESMKVAEDQEPKSKNASLEMVDGPSGVHGRCALPLATEASEQENALTPVPERSKSRAKNATASQEFTQAGQCGVLAQNHAALE